MQWVTICLVATSVGLSACSYGAANPADVRLPDARLMVQPQKVADLPAEAKGNAAMWEGYSQCRLALANEGDLRLGLIEYTNAVRKK